TGLINTRDPIPAPRLRVRPPRPGTDSQTRRGAALLRGLDGGRRPLAEMRAAWTAAGNTAPLSAVAIVSQCASTGHREALLRGSMFHGNGRPSGRPSAPFWNLVSAPTTRRDTDADASQAGAEERECGRLGHRPVERERGVKRWKRTASDDVL